MISNKTYSLEGQNKEGKFLFAEPTRDHSIYQASVRSLLKLPDEETPTAKLKCITDALDQANTVRSIAMADYTKDISGADIELALKLYLMS